MTFDEKDDRRRYMVLINEEQQYSLWPSGKEIPPGWRAAGKEGPEEDCVKYVDEVWTDMRPLSLRRRMEETGRLKGDTVQTPDAGRENRCMTVLP